MRAASTRKTQLSRIILASAVAGVSQFAVMQSAWGNSSLWWDASTSVAGVGGTATWATASLVWNTASDGTGTAVAWPGTSADGIFAGTAGTVTPSNNFNMGNFEVDTPGYVFELGGNRSFTIAAFTGSALANTTFRASTASATRILTLAVSGATSFNGLMTDNGAGKLALTKSVGGTLTLNGTSSYTGATVSTGNGTLRFAKASAYSTASAVTCCSGSTILLNVGAPDEITAAGVAGLLATSTFVSTGILGLDTSNAGGTFALTSGIGSSPLGLAKVGSGTLTMSLANSYTGNTSIGSGGGISLSGAATLGAGTSNLTMSSASLLLGGTTQSVGTVTINDTGTISGGTLAASGTTTASNTGGTATISANLSGTGGLVKSNAGVLLLSGSNSYTGTTTFNAGATLRVGSDTALPASGGNVGGSGTLDLNGFSPSIGSLSGAGTITSSTSGAVTLTLGGNNSSPGAFSGSALDGSGTLTLTKVGTGTWTIANAQTFSGGLNVLNGTVYGQNSAAFGTGRIVLGDTSGNNSAMIEGDNGTGTYANPITVRAGSSGTLAIQQIGSNTPDFSGGILLNNNLTVDALLNKTMKISTKAITQGAGSLTITKGSLAGTATISAGILGSADGLTIANVGAGALTFSLAGITTGAGGLTITNSGSTSSQISVISTSSISGSGGLTLSAQGPAGTASAIGIAGLITTNGAITNNGTGTGWVTLNGGIGSLVTSLTQNSSTSMLKLAGPTNAGFTGPVYIKNGTISAGAASAFTSSNEMTINSGGTFDVATNQIVAGLKDGTSGGGTVTNSNTTATRTLTLGGSTTYSFSGTLSGPTLALTVVAGTHTLSGVNTYGGATAIDNGTLVISGTGSLNGTTGISVGTGSTFQYTSSTALTRPVTFAGSGGSFIYNSSSTTPSPAILVGPGAILSGTGYIQSATITSGGIDSPGNSPGIQHLGSFQLDAGATLLFDVGPTATAGVDSDQIQFISLGDNLRPGTGGNGTLQLANFSPADVGKTYTVFTNVITPAYQFTAITGFDTGTYAAHWQQNVGANSYELSITLVPEPSTILMGAGILFATLMGRRRSAVDERSTDNE